MAAAVIVGIGFFLWRLVPAPVRLHRQLETALAAEVAKSALLTPESKLVERSVRSGLRDFLETARELEIVANRAKPDVWEAMVRTFEVYQHAYRQLTMPARYFHELHQSTIGHCIAAKRYEPLRRPLDELGDILLHGEYDLQVFASDCTLGAVTDKSSRRDRFVVIELNVANQGNDSVSVVPTWIVQLDPGRIHMTYEPDAEPPANFEAHRREIQRRAMPMLPIPLHLHPRQAAVGYWSFFVGGSLERDLQEAKPGRRGWETYLLIRDLASGKRTKSDSFLLAHFDSLATPVYRPPEGS